MALYNIKYDSKVKSKDRIKAEIVFELEKLGYNDYVKWNEFCFTANVGWGMALSLEGVITGDEIIINNCGGAFGPKVLAQIKVMAESIV